MKFYRFGVVSALVAAAAAVGCSSDSPKSGPNGEKTGSIAFKLHGELPSGGSVDFLSAHYDLVTRPALAAVISDDISVARPESVLSLGIQALAYGDYRLRFTANGTYHNPTTGMDQAVTCTSEGDPNENIVVAAPSTELPDITLTCSAVSGQVDNRGNIGVDVDVRLVESTEQNIIETFSYGPRSVLGYLDGTVCTFPVINIKIQSPGSAITYTWSDGTGGGTFSPNVNTEDGTYTCNSGGTKVITLTGTDGTTTSTKQFTVVCDDTPCGFSCGNNVLEGSEQCEGVSLPTLRCSAGCLIDPSCGDGVVDGPGGLCFGGTTNAACTEACDPLFDTNCEDDCTITPPVTCPNGTVDAGEDCDPPNGTTCDASCQRIPTCGDGFIDLGTTPPEQCDDGATGTLPNNSNTLPDACRENCLLDRCGDGVIDSDEQCEPPGTATCTATCQTPAAAEPIVACLDCISTDPNADEIADYYCTTAACQAALACVINSGCYYPNATDCYCGAGVNQDTCRTQTTLPDGPCTALYRAATGNLNTPLGTPDNDLTLDSSTLTTHAVGQALAVAAAVGFPEAVCFAGCGFP